VASLDAASETALIARYRQATSIQTKFSILVVLAYGGTARSIPLFTNALLREFSGRIVTAEEHSMLMDIPVRLGMLAHREPEAVQILLRGTEPAFYEGVDLFRCADRSPNIGLLQGRCIVALAFSGRPEVKEFFDDCYAHPGKVAATDLDVPIRDAVFYGWVIDRYGWERAMDEVLNDQMRRLAQMDAWRSTPEGKRWAIDWRKKVEALRAAKRAQSETPER
jgi:hypothetical protein